MEGQIIPIFDSFMPEAEVSIRVAKHLLGKAVLQSIVEVQIQKSQFTRKNDISFSIGTLMGELKLNQISSQYNADSFRWLGEYELNDKKLVIYNKRLGICDVFANIGGKRVLIQCKGGFLSQTTTAKEYAAIWSVLGQVITTESVENGDVRAIAVPASLAYRQVIAKIKDRPLIKQLGIKFILVSRNKDIEEIGSI